MPDPNELQQFHELTEEIRKLEVDSPEYKAFSAAISATDARLSALSKTAGGLLPVVTERDQNHLLGAHAAISQTAQNLLDAGVSEELKQKVLKLMDVASKNNRMLKAYKPKTERKTIQNLLEDAQAVTLDTRGTEFVGKMTGAQSNRQPISYLDDNGKKVTGVFTPKKVATFWDDAQSIFKEEAEKNNNLTADAKNMLINFLDNCREKIPEVLLQNRGIEDVQKDQYGRKEKDLTTIISGISDPHTNKIKTEFLENAFRKAYPQLQGQNLNSIFGAGTMQRLARKFEKKATPIGIQVDSACIPEGARTDTRNAAMYSVAELLGVPHLVAKAVPMKLVDEKGEVEGTFMMKAKGMDPENLPDEALEIREDSLKGTNGKGYKALADLQVLDYICGNVDRHGSNMFYIFDKNRKFCGVQAIDNDCSLGLLNLKNGKNVNMMIGPDNMKLISRSMYDKIKDLQPAELKFALRGYGLSEAELECAVKRMQKLQTELKKENSKIKIVEDKDFKKIGLQQLRELGERDRKGRSLNLFGRAAGIIRTLGMTRMNQQRAYQDMENMIAIGEQNRALPGAQEREIQTADFLLAQMNSVTKTGWWRLHKGTSPQFEAMRQSVQDYKDYCQSIKDRMDNAKSENRKNDPDAPCDTVIDKDELKEMARLRKTMMEKADTYLGGKQNSKYNSYTNMRKDVASMVKLYGSCGKDVSEAEIKTQEKQMKRACEESDRMRAEQNKAKQKDPVPGLI